MKTTMLVILLVGINACSASGQSYGEELEVVDNPPAPAVYSGEERSSCHQAVNPDSSLLDVVTASATRWEAAHGCRISISASGVPVIAQSRVFQGESTEDNPHGIYDVDPQLTRKELCAATVSSFRDGPLAIYISIANQRCDLTDDVMHELGHMGAPNSQHAIDGIMAPTNSTNRSSTITSGTLEWMCQKLPCLVFNPED